MIYFLLHIEILFIYLPPEIVTQSSIPKKASKREFKIRTLFKRQIYELFLTFRTETQKKRTLCTQKEKQKTKNASP